MLCTIAQKAKSLPRKIGGGGGDFEVVVVAFSLLRLKNSKITYFAAKMEENGAYGAIIPYCLPVYIVFCGKRGKKPPYIYARGGAFAHRGGQKRDEKRENLRQTEKNLQLKQKKFNHKTKN